MANNLVLIKGRHNLVLNEKQEIVKGVNGGLLAIDKISKYFNNIGYRNVLSEENFT